MIKELAKELLGFSSSLDDEKRRVLGFTTNIEDDIKFNLLRKGGWHSLYFASSISFQYGLRIFPDKKVSDWSVVETDEMGGFTTKAPLLNNFLYFKYLNTISHLDGFVECKNNLNKLEEVVSPFLDFVDGKRGFEFYRDYLLNEANLPTSEDESKLKYYLDFWNHYGDGEGFKTMIDLVGDMLKDEQYIPKNIASVDLGVWETRIKNILAQRAYIIQDDAIPYADAEPFLWQSFVQPHGYDSEEIYFDYLPSLSSQCNEEIQGVVELLNAEYYEHADYIKESPLYAALVALYGKDDSYLGVQHVEAAMIYDLEHKDPLKAWDCLVSAAYWSGLNSNETFLPAWKAAIELCERNNWKDAHDALLLQWEFYHDYKSKNGLA